MTMMTMMKTIKWWRRLDWKTVFAGSSSMFSVIFNPIAWSLCKPNTVSLAIGRLLDYVNIMPYGYNRWYKLRSSFMKSMFSQDTSNPVSPNLIPT